jgi:hypothetical protein
MVVELAVHFNNRVSYVKGVIVMKKSLIALVACSAIAAHAQTNKIYIDQDGSQVSSLSIQQTATSANNLVGSSGSPMVVGGRWSSITIDQTNTGSSSNSIGGAVHASRSVGGSASLALTQTGGGNAMTLNAGTADAPLADPNIVLQQIGNGNSATYTLTGSTTTTVSDTTTGDDNSVTVNSSGSSYANTTAITGNSNQVELTRSGGAYTDNITIGGDSNTVSIAAESTGTNTATVNIGGVLAANFNSLTATQSGSNSSLTASIDGSNNQVTITQTMVDNGSVNVSFVGNGNTLTASQTAANTSATVSATGNSNTFTLAQAGAGALANINVSGDSLNVNVTQNAADSVYRVSGALQNGTAITVTQN